MKDARSKILAIIGIVVLYVVVQNLPFERESSEITDWLYEQSEEQVETNTEMVDKAASTVEDSVLVGEHQIHGANWSIPNLIRHWVLGVN